MDCEDYEDARTIWFAMQPKQSTIEITQPKDKGKVSDQGFN